MATNAQPLAPPPKGSPAGRLATSDGRAFLPRKDRVRGMAPPANGSGGALAGGGAEAVVEPRIFDRLRAVLVRLQVKEHGLTQQVEIFRRKDGAGTGWFCHGGLL